MIARAAAWGPMPEDDRQWAIDAAETVPGVRDAHHLVDPQTGNGLSIALFDDGVDVDAVERVIAQRLLRPAGTTCRGRPRRARRTPPDQPEQGTTT